MQNKTPYYTYGKQIEFQNLIKRDKQGHFRPKFIGPRDKKFIMKLSFERITTLVVSFFK